VVLQATGGLLVLGGAAVTGVQSVAVATLIGVTTAAGFIALGALPGRVLLSMLGSLGLLVFVPWTLTSTYAAYQDIFTPTPAQDELVETA